MKGEYAKQLWELIVEYRLDDRYDELAFVRFQIEQGKISEGLAKGYLYQVDQIVQQQIDFPNYLHAPPAPEQFCADGEYDIPFGSLVERDGLKVGIRSSGAAHSIFAGTTEAGKTTSIRSGIHQIHRFNQSAEKPISKVIVDRKGNDYGDLKEALGDDCVHLSVYDGLRLALHSPAGVPVHVWCSIVCTLFCARAGLIAAWTALAGAMQWLVAALNPKGGADRWPDLQLIHDFLKKAPQLWAAKGEYWRSLQGVLQAAILASGDLFRAFRGLDLERDIIAEGKSVIISINILDPPWLRLFVVDLLISQVLIGRIHRHHRVDRTEVLFILDEADADVSRESELAFRNAIPPIQMALRMGREFGVGVWLGLSMLGPASRFVLSNATYWFLHRMVDAECVREASRSLLLPRGASSIISFLKNGEVLFRHPVSWPHAVLALMDYFPPCRTPMLSGFDTHP